jgi:endogenous inhibitor of DNA gyrase (YacG/DUF329 family)
MLPCPICHRPASPRAQNPAAPFCTTRCKQVDLDKWLGESYRVPVTDDPDALEEALNASILSASLDERHQ